MRAPTHSHLFLHTRVHTQTQINTNTYKHTHSHKQTYEVIHMRFKAISNLSCLLIGFSIYRSLQNSLNSSFKFSMECAPGSHLAYWASNKNILMLIARRTFPRISDHKDPYFRCIQNWKLFQALLIFHPSDELIKTRQASFLNPHDLRNIFFFAYSLFHFRAPCLLLW